MSYVTSFFQPLLSFRRKLPENRTTEITEPKSFIVIPPEPEHVPEPPKEAILTPILEIHIANAIAKRIKSGQSARLAITKFITNWEDDVLTSKRVKQIFTRIHGKTPDEFYAEHNVVDPKKRTRH